MNTPLTDEARKQALELCATGDVLQAQGQWQQAEECYCQALELAPHFVAALVNRSNVRRAVGDAEGALADLSHALELKPDFPEALSNQGNVLRDLGRFAAARQAYERALSLRPDFALAACNLGKLDLDAGDARSALMHFEGVLRQQSTDAEARFGRACALLRLRVNLELAEQDFRMAESLGIPAREVLVGLAAVQAALGRHVDAAQSFDRLLLVDASAEYALGSALHCKMHSCDWSDFDAQTERLAALIRCGERVVHPQTLLSMVDSPSLQHRCAQTFAAHYFPVSHAGAQCQPADDPSTGRRIRLVYVSGDLRDHPVAALLSGIIERHDRACFEVIAVSLAAGGSSALQRRVRAAFDECIDADGWSDAELRDRVRALQPDIVIDLMGMTDGNRMAALAPRVAPVQVMWLGFAGTANAVSADYLIADAFALPEASEPSFAEAIVRLPGCCLPNDDRRAVGPPPSRSDEGLPERGFVFAAFCAAYKIHPRVFDVWMRLLAARPGSVLWLGGVGVAARENLRREAGRRGIESERLRFAQRRDDSAQHLARLALADLCLDTWPYNAHSTAIDLLWAGVPLLTYSGHSLASRLAGSALKAAGLPELVCSTLEAYEHRALELSGPDSMLADLRLRLQSARHSQPLFDTTAYCRRLESAYRALWDQAQHGRRVAGFARPRRMAHG